MKQLKRFCFTLCACLFLSLMFNSEARAQTQEFVYYQYSDDGSQWGYWDFGNDPATCPSYEVRPNVALYVEGRTSDSGNSYSFSLYSGNPDSQFNYGGFQMVTLAPGEYALLKADFSTSSGTVTKYIYLYCPSS